MNYIYFAYKLDTSDMGDALLEGEAEVLIDCLQKKFLQGARLGKLREAMRKAVFKKALTHGENISPADVYYEPAPSVVLQPPSIKPLKVLEHDRDASLYVFAHGSPGVVGTRSDRVSLSAKDLAVRLIEDGLPRNVAKIKLFACHSGVDAASGSSFAQDLCRALCAEHCLPSLIVSGYLGKASPDLSLEHRTLIGGVPGKQAKRSFTGRAGDECVLDPLQGVRILH